MKSFRSFIQENFDFKSEGGKILYHRAEVAGHRIAVFFMPDDWTTDSTRDSWGIGFQVDDVERGRAEVSKIDSFKILAYVTKAIDAFRKQHKPKELHFYANNDFKAPAYRAFAAMLHKRWGGEYYKGEKDWYNKTTNHRFFPKNTDR